MTNSTKNLIHGRETYIADFGQDFVMKRPLPTFGPDKCEAWLRKQHRTKLAIDEIYNIGNPRYNIPRMLYIKNDEFQLLEERAPGMHLTADLFRTLSQRQKYEIIDGIAAFLVDMNELKPIQNINNHKISTELKFDRLCNFIYNKMDNWFTSEEIQYMEQMCYNIENFTYDTRYAWSHCDLNSGNVLYDPQTSKLSFIDFAEADYSFIYRDIFSPLQIELGIYKHVYQRYYQLHDKRKYSMPSATNDTLRDIMKFRMMFILLRRFIKASDDLRTNPQSGKSIQNNLNKIAFMREQIAAIKKLDKQCAK
ncbi:MAG: phosphotransferase [Alphaproteobacteria bacterium]|nr:phosphotransferase [Alphaproteobacteria bacterium]